MVDVGDYGDIAQILNHGRGPVGRKGASLYARDCVKALVAPLCKVAKPAGYGAGAAYCILSAAVQNPDIGRYNGVRRPTPTLPQPRSFAYFASEQANFPCPN